MSLLVSEEFSEKLHLAISEATGSIIFVSAFITTPAIDWLKSHIHDGLNVTILSRWKKHDLLSGASDIAVYEYCAELGWKFGIDQNLHGKLYLIDTNKIFLGSANLTRKGLSIGMKGNLEFGTVISAEAADISKINDYIKNEIVWVDSELFELLNNEYRQADINETPTAETEWSFGIQDRLVTPVNYLWVQELLFSTPVELIYLDLKNENVIHDYKLLDLDLDALDEEYIRSAFMQSKLHYWLLNKLRDNRELNFGALSYELHNALLENPKPYRKKVKEFVVIIFKWAEFLPNIFNITQYDHTQSLSLK